MYLLSIFTPDPKLKVTEMRLSAYCIIYKKYLYIKCQRKLAF